MGKKLQRLSLFVGLLLYLFDFGSDIYVAVQYWKNNEVWWFGMTIGLIIGPSIIVNITAIFEKMDEWTCITAVLQLSFLARYIEALKSLDSVVYFLAKLRYLETIMESAPQWCLQVYIMLREWYFPSYTVVSSALSLASLAWSITTLEKKRANEEDRIFGPVKIVLFVIWQLFTLISRLSAIVIFAYVFRYYVIIFLAVHYLFLAVGVLILQMRSHGDDSLGKSLLLSCLAAYPSLFHSLETILPTRNPKVEMGLGYIFIVVGNIIMVTLSITIEIPGAPYMDILQPIAISCLVGGSVLSFIGFIFFTGIGQIELTVLSSGTVTENQTGRHSLAFTISDEGSMLGNYSIRDSIPNLSKDNPGIEHTQMHNASQASSSRETIPNTEPSILSVTALSISSSDLGRTNVTMEHRNSDNTRMDNLSITLFTHRIVKYV